MRTKTMFNRLCESPQSLLFFIVANLLAMTGKAQATTSILLEKTKMPDMPVYTVTFVNVAQWNEVYAYAWTYKNNVTTEYTAPWPGSQIEKTGTKTLNGVDYGIYTFSVSANEAPEFIIFNSGNWGESEQSADLPFVDGMEYENLYPPVEVTFGESGYTTLSSDYLLSFANIQNVTAYRASEVTDNGVLLMTPVGPDTEFKAPANTGLFLIGEPNSTVLIPTSFIAQDLGDNYLIPAVDGTIVYPSQQGKYRYTFQNRNGHEGFYEVKDNSVEIEAGTAFLETDAPLATGQYSRVRWLTYENYLNYGTSGGAFAVEEGVSYQFGEEITSVEGVKMTFGQKLPAGQERTGQYADFNAGQSYYNVEGYEAYTIGNDANPKDDNNEGFKTLLGNIPTNGTFYTFEPEFDGALTMGIVLNTGKPFYILEDGVPVPEFQAVYISKEYGTKYYGLAGLNVKGGKKYHVFATGSKLGFFGFTYSPGMTTDIIGPEGTREVLLSMLSYSLPEEDILYDGEPHATVVQTDTRMGVIHIIYRDETGNESETAPSDPGIYTITFDIEEGEVFSAARFDNVGTFTIYEADQQEWAMLQTAYQALGQGSGWNKTWDFSQGIKGAKSLYGVGFAKGHVTRINLSNNGLKGNFPVDLLKLPYLEDLILHNNSLSGNLAETIANFQQENPNMAISVKRINIESNQLSGNIGAFANALPNLTDLYISDNMFDEVSPMISPSVTFFIGHQNISRVIDLHLANLSAASLAAQTPTILLYSHSQQNYNAPLYLDLSDNNNWYVSYSYQNGNFQIVGVSQQNVYKGESGDLLNIYISSDEGADAQLQLQLSFDEGDANFNGSIDILDLQATLNYMFEDYKDRPFNFTAANLWRDEQINVQDAVCLVNVLMEPKPSTGGTTLFYESFNSCSSTGGNDGLWNSSIASGDLIADNAGWDYNKGYGANQCAKFGSSSVVGYATTPIFSINGSATLTFKAAPWNQSAEGTNLALSVNGNATLSSSSVEMVKGSWTDYTVTITGTGEISITFTGNKRFFLDEVRVTGAESTAPMMFANTDTQYAEANVYCEDGKLMINSTKPVAAFDIVISNCQSLNISSDLQQCGFTCTTKQTANGLHLIGYSLGGSTLSIGETVLGQLNNVNAIVTYAKLADGNADEITSSTSNQETTSVEDMFTPNEYREVYRLRLGNGQYISIDNHGNKILKNENIKK